MRGRKPKPTALKILDGNPGRRPLREREPEPRIGRPSCPHWLDLEAKREWRRISRELHAMGLLTQADRAALAAYCQCWSDWRSAVEAIREHGRTFSTEKGEIRQRPEVALGQKALTLLKSYLVEFGLTPSSRTRISVPVKPLESLDALLG